MVNNTSWLINELSSYFEGLTTKGFSDTIIVEHKFKNQFPDNTLPVPKIMVSEILNNAKDFTNDGERASDMGFQLNIYAGIMEISGEIYEGFDCVEYISVLVDNFMTNTLKMNRVGNAESMPSEENPTNEYVKPMRYEYTQDLNTNKIYRR